MRTFVHLLLLICAIVVAVGTFGPLVGTVDARNVQWDDLRNGFAPGQTLDQIHGHSVAFQNSLALGLVCVAAAILISALTGFRPIGGLGVLAGLIGLGILAWRLDDRFDSQLRNDTAHLLGNNTWGLWLVGGGLLVALLCLLTPRERRAF
ncbi:hypothetical protein ACIP5Y_11090 [Nocardia sp. NPDC088792]|uniref:hypothetical protein n=1 Tax=Nocardia sp. NPDC088792 TaxID=3364332 RepID=UPI0038091FFB